MGPIVVAAALIGVAGVGVLLVAFLRSLGRVQGQVEAMCRTVEERLQAVHRGLGAMQSMASGVGDLKRLLSNVKVRGTWGEVQLGALLEDVLAPEQYDVDVSTGRGGERVEFAIRLPADEDGAGVVWLPIDSKLPLEDYQRLLDAEDAGDDAAAARASAALEQRLCRFAREVQGKYLHPPRTTDFAILFLPTESLFGEVLRRPGLAERLRRDHHAVLAGPTTLAALLNALRMGFRTLAIQKRSSEVWKLLGTVKTDVGRFGALLDTAQKKLEQASETLDDASRKTRHLEARLRAVESTAPEHTGGSGQVLPL